MTVSVQIRSRFVIAFICLVLSLALAHASHGLAEQSADIVSPEILPDGKVVFRILAPDAESVTVGGDYPIGNKYQGDDTKLTRDGHGVWSVTLGPLPVDYYGYYYVVDGRRTLDLNNIFILRDGMNYLSVLRVPGPELADYEVNDVSHGTLSITWYPSPALKKNRRIYIYTPPGYESGNLRYPVLYLLHGGSNDENAWTALGHAPQILDNLIAQGKVKPMIVVMPNANATLVAEPNYMLAESYPESNTSRGDRVITDFPKSLVTDLVPFIDKTYRTKSDKEHRAIAGLSVGGAQTLFAAFNHPELFSYVAAFSGGFPRLPGVAVDIEPPVNANKMRGPDITRTIDPERFLALHPKLNAEVNSQLKLFYISMGMEDGLITTHGVLKGILESQGVEYTLMEKEGYGHEWRFWRLSLHDLLPRLF
jgi:enterochelin esterase family protein